MTTTTARAHANIAFIKYWGNRDHDLRLPENGSLSMNLAGLDTVTHVTPRPDLTADVLVLNGEEASGQPLTRVREHLDVMRAAAGVDTYTEVVSENSFPTGTGIASSASAFAALTVAAAAAFGMEADEATLSRLARRGSGSASRSIPGGFVEWSMGTGDGDSFAKAIAPPDYWDLVDLVAVVSTAHKAVGSTGGHKLASSSPLQGARVDDAERRLDLCRGAILERDFDTFATIIEHDALVMHAVMMTSQPPLLYWEPATLALFKLVRSLRLDDEFPVAFTIDAGPNVHIITRASFADAIQQQVQTVGGVQHVYRAEPGGPATIEPA